MRQGNSHAYLVLLLLWQVCTIATAQHFEFSSGLYRMPYEDNIEVHVFSDVYTHSPKGKYDILCDETNPVIVAAADGWVRWIEESFDTTCHNGTDCCWEFNNFVIIQHPNGEWSNYTHMDQGSVSAAGITLNEWVTAGTPLGTEGNIGCSTEKHLHFEVSRPFNPATPFDTIGGFLNCLCSTGDNSAISDMLIPVISGFAPWDPFLQAGYDYDTGPMDDVCASAITANNTLYSGQEEVLRAETSIITDTEFPVELMTGSTASYRSGGYVRLMPGFHAQYGSKLLVIIKDCNEQN